MNTDFKGFVRWWNETYDTDVTEEMLTDLAKHQLIYKTSQDIIEKVESLNNMRKNFKDPYTKETFVYERIHKDPEKREERLAFLNTVREKHWRNCLNEADELIKLHDKLEAAAFGDE